MMNDCQFGLAADARDTLIGLVAMRYKEAKKDGLVDFWGDAVDTIAMEIVTKAISKYSEKEGKN